MDKEKELEDWAARSNKTVAELEEELKKLMEWDIIKAMPANMHEIEAMRVLKNRYARSIILGGVEAEYHVMIIGKGSKRTIQIEKNGVKEPRDVLNMLGIGKKTGTNDFIGMPVTAWGEDIAKLPQLEKFTVYKVNLKEKVQNSKTVFNSTQNSVWVKEKVVPKDQAVSLVKKCFNEIKFTEYESAVANGKVYAIEGSIIRHFKSERDGRKFAVYGIIPMDMTDIEDQIETQGLSIWVDPADMQYGDDSRCVFIGQIRRGKNGNINMSGDGVIPIVEFPLNEAAPVEEASDEFGGPAAPTPVPAAKPAEPEKKPAGKKEKGVFDNVKIMKGNDVDDPFGLP